MVICDVTRGLGNQLFQYAAGRALAIRLKTSLKLDTTFYKVPCNEEIEPPRTFELERFRIQATLITQREKWISDRWQRPRITKALRASQRVGLNAHLTVLEDPEQGFDPCFETATGHVYLKGFWQSELYFASIADILRQELVLRSEPDLANLAMIESIQSVESVALHVRRGDYTNVAKKSHGTCSLDYYRLAIEKLLGRVRDPHFFVFSDDPDWAKENIKIGLPATYVTHNTGRQDFEDLRLMSRCRHFIMANSSFSWWGAWLGRNAAKNVIAPSRWYADQTKSTTDLIPPAWMRL